MFPLGFNQFDLTIPSYDNTFAVPLNGMTMCDFSPTFNFGFSMPTDTFNLDLTTYSDAQFQMYLFSLLQSISINPIINHEPTPEIKSNFRPYNYSKYKDSGDKISKLDPEMQKKTMDLLDYANSLGLKVTITSGYRTEEEQQALLIKYPDRAAKKSQHCKGKAIDINIANGTDSDYKKLGDYAKSIGMRWGGDFKNPRPERWHFDLGLS